MTATITPALEPELTRFDRRVLAALDHPKPGILRIELRSAWQIAELVREDDVRLVRMTLRGLTHFGYAASLGWGHGQRWRATGKGL